MQFTETAFSPVSPVLATRSKTWKQLISHHQEAFITVSLWSTKPKTNSVRRQRQYLTAGCRVLHSQLDESHKERDSPLGVYPNYVFLVQRTQGCKLAIFFKVGNNNTSYVISPRSRTVCINAKIRTRVFQCTNPSYHKILHLSLANIPNTIQFLLPHLI